MTHIVAANALWLRIMDCLGCDGLAMPWRTIYLRPSAVDDPTLIAHELVHIEQMDRDGTVPFCVKYLYYLVKHGYWQSPYEIEAYARAQASAAAGAILTATDPSA